MGRIAEARQRIKRWREDPVTFVVEELHATPDDYQVEFLRAFPTNQRLALKACKGPGKTTVLSWAAWNFLATRPHPKVAATSISGDNLFDNLWTEMSKWQQRSEFLQRSFKWGKTRIESIDHPETWWMSARTWSKSADAAQQANTLAGLHAEYLMFILDESGGIPDSVMAAAEGGLSTGTELKILQAGNPTHLEGPLYRACTTERHLWYVIEITADPDDPHRAKRVNVDWARQQIDKYGRDNPWVLVNVFGKFPPGSINSLLSVDEVQAAMRRKVRETDVSHMAMTMGMDVARYGDDRSVIFPKRGLLAYQPHIYRNLNTHELAAALAFRKNEMRSEMEFVDDTGGWAAGVIDTAHTLGVYPIPVNFSSKAQDPRYVNKRAEMHFRAATWVKNGGALPDIQELVKEATACTYVFTNGKMLIEDKDIIKAKIGTSPDLWDAFVLNFALESPVQEVDPQSPMGMYKRFGGGDAAVKKEWDTYAELDK